MKSQLQCTATEAYTLRGQGPSYFYREVHAGVMVPPVTRRRFAHYSVAEVMACTEAALAGWSPAKRRELVAELLLLRQRDLPETPAQLAQAAATRYEGIVPPRPAEVRRRASSKASADAIAA